MILLTTSRGAGNLSPLATELYDWNPVPGVEDAGRHALRYLQRCCAHVAAAFVTVMHPALNKMMPTRDLDSMVAGLTSYTPETTAYTKESMKILVEAVHGRRDLGTLHPEALIIQLAAAASQFEALDGQPSTNLLCPCVGFEEVARALKGLFTSQGTVYVGMHEELCAPCLWLRQGTGMHSVEMGSEQCAVVPWTPPAGVSLEVLQGIELKLMGMCKLIGIISR
ncbi:hypothetical protein FA95DRAFT_1277157 [Auriscalpium vulgare]|uniref:Uncharacterized protein n=1 Tax=Auriscalpium vulgare TaxID=40419 RepID=A0ACB8R2G0_9AGAM|nr:hypothetical protein FA95DRAFT_1277157 [Auriscalpium vulgare]